MHAKKGWFGYIKVEFSFHEWYNFAETDPETRSREKMVYTTCKTQAGWVGVLASEKGLLAASLPRPTEEEAVRELGEATGQSVKSPTPFGDLEQRFQAYFRGETVSFRDELDLSGATPFQRQVWQQTRLIPYGQTRSYQQIADAIGKPGAARAVGQALGKNPLLVIIPCHRVLASSGGLGGFGGGLKMKKRLLELEGRILP